MYQLVLNHPFLVVFAISLGSGIPVACASTPSSGVSRSASTLSTSLGRRAHRVPADQSHLHSNDTEAVPYITTLQKCLLSPHALLVCIEAGIISLTQVAKHFVRNGAKLVKRLEAWGGKVIKGGKGSHTKVRMPNGRVETVPHKPAEGTVKAIFKRALEDVEKAR